MIRTKRFNVTPDGISPYSQYAGRQGENRATRVELALSSDLVADGYVYRVEYLSEQGAYDTTATVALTDNTISVEIVNGWTQTAGNHVLRLNICDADGMEAYSADCIIRIEERDTGTTNTPEEIETGLTALILETEAARDSANTAAGEVRSEMAGIKAVDGIVKGDGAGNFSAADAGDMPITDEDEHFTAGTVEGALEELADNKVDKVTGKALSTNDYTDADKAKVDNLPADTNTALTETNLRIATINKSLSDYRNAIASINVNQSPKQTASGYGTVSLPVNAANGQISASVGGNTLFNLADNGEDYENWMVGAGISKSAEGLSTSVPGYAELPANFKPSTVYTLVYNASIPAGCAIVVLGNLTGYGVNLQNGFHKIAITTQSSIINSNLRLLLGTSGSTVTFALYGVYKGDQTANTSVDYPMSYGTNSTISAGRLVSENEDETEKTYQYYPDVGLLRSLPNGVKDEVSGGQKIQRIKEHVLQANDIIYAADHVNTNGVFVAKPLDYIGRGIDVYINGNATISGMNEGSVIDDISSIGNFNSTSTTAFLLRFTKGTYPTTAAAQAALTGTKLTYQLAEPIVTPVNVTGTLIGHPNGMVYWEPVLPVAGVYTASGIEVTDTDFPIESLESISKIDFMTGVETEVDVSQAVIAGDGLSFTHPDLIDGDIVFFTYYHAVESTQPEIDVEYYDSRYTVEDSAVSGTFYRWKVTVANGVPSLEIEMV